MNKYTKTVTPLEVAHEIVEFVVGKYGQHAENPVVLEGLLLSMQMIGGPHGAAEVVGYCFRVD